jgi:release factor glutamine methyltransferase
MTIEEANRLLIASLSEIYDEREASSISSLVMEHLMGMPKSLRLLHKTQALTGRQEELLKTFLDELMRNRPVQYVLGEAWFGSLPFFVDENVLIPRPETEELADWLLKDSLTRGSDESVLDIGTGSGCIPVYLKKKRNNMRVMALDISEAALEIAKKNSRVHEAAVDFFLCDILDPVQREVLPAVDLIISNPPYIPEKQKAFLDKHVKDFEPGLALFVPDEDPVLFYKIIGDLAKKKMNPGGALYLEIHHDYAKEIMKWFKKNDFTLELRQDFSGNNRLIKVQRI